jgi:protocatechuate 3,4-dioxygenase beta subunit
MTGVHRRGLLALGLAGAGAAGLAQAAPDVARPVGLTPQTTEGPYYRPNPPVRADITEGLPGAPLDMRFVVRDPAGAPLPGARVDIWHCDAAGRYSGFASAPGREPDAAQKAATYLRGVQTTDAQGAALFHTVYPGWYAGRTTHIHFKVWQGDRAVLTCQLFLPDALSEFLYTQVPAYKRRRLRDTLNRTDGIAIMAGERTLGSIREAGDRYLASLAVAVDPAAHPLIDRPPAPGPHPLGRRPPGPPPPGLPPLPPGGPHRRAPLAGEARIEALLPGKAPLG